MKRSRIIFPVVTTFLAIAVSSAAGQSKGPGETLTILPEETDEKSEAYKTGYKNICEIGKERIRRAGKKIEDEVGMYDKQLDIGFRVLKVDSTNM